MEIVRNHKIHFVYNNEDSNLIFAQSQTVVLFEEVNEKLKNKAKIVVTGIETTSNSGYLQLQVICQEENVLSKVYDVINKLLPKIKNKYKLDQILLGD